MCDKIVILGGGIIGASFAYHAHLRGIKDITIIMAALPGSSEQATSNSWGWVNGYADDDEDYAAFRLASLAYWPSVIAAIEGYDASSKGAFIWDLDAAALPRSIAQHRAWGHDVQLMARDAISASLPALSDLPDQAGFGAGDLGLESAEITRRLIAASGAQIIHAQITALKRDGARIIGVECAQGSIEAHNIILAAGLGCPSLLASVNVDFEMRSTMGLLAYTTPMPPLLAHPITGRDFHARQTAEGRLVIGGKFGADAADDGDLNASAEQLVRAMADRLALTDADVCNLVLDYYTVGARPLPKDGRPKIGTVTDRDGVALDGLYLAVMHSGITNAPLAGKLGIDEIITGKRDNLLTPFAP